MRTLVEEMAFRITEGFQSPSIKSDFIGVNLFHRNIATHESRDISFITGLVSTGLRGCVELAGEDLLTNYNQIITACRQHLPLVIQTSSNILEKDGYSILSNFENINAIRHAGCPQFVATNYQEHIYLTLIAHRIAELALIPVLIVKDYSENEPEEFKYPDNKLIVEYLGSADDQISCPSPSQEIIFGQKRRKIPNWFSMDTPLMLGAHKDGKHLAYENAANQEYFANHIPELIDKAFTEFKSLFKFEISPIKITGSSESAILSIGSKIDSVIQDSEKNNQILNINLLQLYPFPGKLLSERLKNIKALTVFEYAGNCVLEEDISKVITSLNVKLYAVKHGENLNSSSLDCAIEHMLTNQDKTNYYLDIEFTKDSDYPKHDILLTDIKKAYPDIERKSVVSEKKILENVKADNNSDLPNAIRKYCDQGPKYSHLSRFYDDTAFFFQKGQTDELVADPFNAIPVIPAATSNFHKTNSRRLPVFDALSCTGCGDCFIQCPHSAIPPVSIGIEQLVRASVEIATSKGASISKLTPLMKNLAKVAGKAIADSDIKTAGECLELAFDNLVAQMKLEGEKLEIIKTEFNLVLDVIKDFSVSVNDTFYNNPNTIEAGAGELFALAINPNACTGCGICSEICEEGALPMEENNPEILGKAKNQFSLWEQLPDTLGDNINRLYHDKDYNSLAAMLLSRSYYMSMTNAGRNDQNAPYKTLLHLITSSIESLVQPKLVEKIKYIDELINDLTENIHSKLSGALPKDNLEGLSKSLKASLGRKLTIKDVVNQISDQDQGKLIDTLDLNRKTDLVEILNQLKWVLSEGPTGTGRSRYGLVLSGSESLSWAREYPYNNFISPVIIEWKGSAPEQIMGLLQGQLRYLLDNIKIIRRAELEIKDKYDPSVHDNELVSLSWDDLTDKEKELIPAMVLVAERSDLGDLGWNSLNKVLAGKWPVKVFLLDNAISPVHTDYLADLAQTSSGIFSTISLKNAFVFQGSMSNINHLFDGLLDGLNRPYPALFNLYAAKRDKHISGDVNWMPLASLAMNSRIFPALRYDPEENQGFLSGGISLEGNRNNESDWYSEEILLKEGEDSIDYTITWADWAYSQKNWIKEFNNVDQESDNISIAEYLKLDNKSRKDKTPIIIRSSEDGIKYYAASEKVITMTGAVLSNWNTLQEVAGLLTEFPLKLRENVVKELSKKYETELTELKMIHQKELQEQESNQTEIIRQKLKEKLVALTAMAQDNSAN